ncbi:type III-B CRISPR-associated protein Cas10/Cmr2 [Melghirimyces algeriensis]|uniref:CRISPR-associated protein, Cmr2 family n=1 Tax=Melghirimyces algeriensis TaxID=910412 RepID=A0A521AP69_9BACL|nr:type III-B CRISPR-associated protein Cas10/Cmr2 [Melghirimyces algeriensis]SMO36430.1 CRISPR-associated protein, Cmr2 family [Melghirimyces algeriensis]
MKTLQLTIGPVQSFVSQARRTRDLLAGSFLLSFLSGQAMAEVLRRGGEIRYPLVHDENKKILDPLLQAIYDGETPKTSLSAGIGSLPNRFQAQICKNTHPKEIAEAVDCAWKKVANAVWKKVFPNGCPEATKTIWDRQVDEFWEISWVMGNDSSLLSRRKYWHSHFPPSEPGDKCTLTGNLQELSGFVRSREPKQQQEFWESIREKKWISAFDLQENERLSAIGLIKRFYPLVAEEALEWKLPKGALNFPSTGYLAAMPWIFSRRKEQQEEMRNFTQLAQQAKIMCSEDPGHEVDSKFYKLEGNAFFLSNIQRENYWREHGWEQTSEEKAALQKALYQSLYRLTDEGKDTPSPFYALLLMDGDQLGQLLDDQGEKVSQGLAQFTADLPEIVQEERGFTVYAGGDDVLALFPLKNGLPAAVRLRQAYQRAFADISSEASISAALVYAHYKAPLQSVLKNAHELLDDVAKRACGRDSLAIRVWKGGGPVWTWSCPWQEALKGQTDQSVLETVARQIQGEQAYTPSFFHHLRSRLEPWHDPDEKDQKTYQERIQQLLVAEYRRSNGTATREQAEERMEALMSVCLEKWRDPHKNIQTGRFRTEGALIAHFLATEGRGQD